MAQFQPHTTEEILMHLVIAVLGHGEATRVDEATKERIHRAFARAKSFQLDGGEAVSIFFMAGVGRTASIRTLAERMMLYARGYIEKENIDERLLRLHDNQREFEVWGTLEEMRWAIEEAERLHRCPYIEYVTNKRHARRVKLTAWVLGKSEPHVIESADAASPLLHEIGAYLKLLTYYIPPVYRFGQFVRRTTYSGG